MIEDSKVIEAMLKHGGGFVKNLARAAQVADSDNLARIKNTWSDYWSRYEAMSVTDSHFKMDVEFTLKESVVVYARDTE